MYEKPQIGSTVTVKTKYFDWADPHEYKHTGEVIAVSWLKPDEFAIKNPQHPNGFSVINLSNVVSLKSNKSTVKLDTDYKEWTVTGSKGNTYLVIRQKGKYNCSCPGYTFRKHCRHISELA